MNTRTLQTHFAKHAVVKGSKAAQLASAVKEELFKLELNGKDDLTQRAYKNAVTVETLIMTQLELAQKDPSQAFKAAAAVKLLSLAAAGLERLHNLKWTALGMNRDSVVADDLPKLIFQDLSEQEIKEIQQGHDQEQLDDQAPNDEPDQGIEAQERDPWDDEEDDVIVEGSPRRSRTPRAADTFGVPRPCRPIASRHDSVPNADGNRSLVNVNHGFHPIQRALPGYDRRSLTSGAHCRMATSECRIGKTAGGRTARLNYAVIAPPVRPVRNRRSHRGFSFPDPHPHSVLKSIFKAQSSRRLYLQCKMCWRRRVTHQLLQIRIDGQNRTTGISEIARMHNNARRRRVAVGQHSLENLMTCSFRHCAIIFCPKHQRGRLLGCSALEATGS